MTLSNEKIREILEGAPEGVLIRHQNKDRNMALNEATCKLSDIVNNHDPEVDIPIEMGVWDCLDDATATIEAPLYREILTLRQRVEELEAQQSEVAARAVEDKKVIHYAGIKGKFYDSPTTCRAYTHKEQPDNIVAMRIGESCRNSMSEHHGDLIDVGLIALRYLQGNGLGVFEIRKGEGDE